MLRLNMSNNISDGLLDRAFKLHRDLVSANAKRFSLNFLYMFYFF